MLIKFELDRKKSKNDKFCEYLEYFSVEILPYLNEVIKRDYYTVRDLIDFSILFRPNINSIKKLFLLKNNILLITNRKKVPLPYRRLCIIDNQIIMYNLYENNTTFWDAYIKFRKNMEKVHINSLTYDWLKEDDKPMLELIGKNLEYININSLLGFEYSIKVEDYINKDNFEYYVDNSINNLGYKIKYSSLINKGYRRGVIPDSFIINNKDKINWGSITYKAVHRNYVGFNFIYTFLDIISTEELEKVLDIRIISNKMRKTVEEELERRKVK